MINFLRLRVFNNSQSPLAIFNSQFDGCDQNEGRTRRSHQFFFGVLALKQDPSHRHKGPHRLGGGRSVHSGVQHMFLVQEGHSFCMAERRGRQRSSRPLAADAAGLMADQARLKQPL